MFGDRLKLARKKAGLSLDALVAQLDGLVSKQALSKYERGMMMPGSNVLIALAKAVDVSIEYLLSEEVTGLEQVDFRKQVRTSAKDKARVEASVIDHMQRYLVVEELLELDSAEWNSPKLKNAGLDCIEDAEDLADELRKKWDLGDDAILNMTLLLEENGIKVLVLDLPSNVSGMTCIVRRKDNKGTVPVVVVNRNKSLERRRFTLAHELAHMIFDLDDDFGEKAEEEAAQSFAGAFLVPRSHLVKETGAHRGKIGYREIMTLKRIYRVSAAALVKRLEQIGVISSAALSTIYQTIGKSWRTSEPEEIELLEDRGEIEKPKRFERLTYWALAEQFISPAKAMELLKLPLEEIEQAMRGPLADARHRQ